MKKTKVNNSYIFKVLPRKSMIVSVENSELYTLNETASYILKYIKKGLTKEEIKEKLLRAYDASEEEVEKDLERTLNFFISKKILLYE